MADTKRGIKNEEIKKETTEPEAVSQSTAMQERMESVSRKILITARNELYYMQYTQIRKFWDRAQRGGRKSVRLEELDPEWFFQLKNGYFVPYLDLIQKDLETRD